MKDRRLDRRRAGFAILVLLAASLAGCAERHKEALVPGYDAVAAFGAEEEGESAGAITADASLASFESGSRRFAVIEGDRVSEVIDMKVSKAGENEWRTDVAGRRGALIRVDGGALLLVQTIDYPNKAVTTFDPPLPLIGDGMAIGEQIETECSVVVRSLDDASSVIDRGTGRQTLERQRNQDVHLPGGRTERAAHLQRSLALKLQRASVNEVTISWYVPQLGLAAERSKEEVRVLGPLGWTHERVMVRVP